MLADAKAHICDDVAYVRKLVELEYEKGVVPSTIQGWRSAQIG